MKKLFLIFTVLLLASCSSEDDAGDVITSEFSRISTILPQGTWKVTTLIEANEDHTMDFESLIFTFNSDGTVVSETDLFSETGNWYYESSSENGERLILDFGDIIPVDQLSKDWKIVSVTTSKVELSEEGENQEDIDLLVFTKL